MSKGFISVSLIPFLKKLGRSSYDFTMNYYDIISICLDLQLKPKAYSGKIFLFQLWAEEDLLRFIWRGKKGSFIWGSFSPMSIHKITYIKRSSTTNSKFWHTQHQLAKIYKIETSSHCFTGAILLKSSGTILLKSNIYIKCFFEYRRLLFKVHKAKIIPVIFPNFHLFSKIPFQTHSAFLQVIHLSKYPNVDRRKVTDLSLKKR